MARPSLPPAAEALFRAHQDRSTGWLTLLSHGREAKLYVQFGDLVGARLGFGHQTESQALLASGALVPPALDLLWARGQLGDLARVCEAAGVDSSLASEVRALASVRRVAVLAEEASFMPALVEVTFPRIRGARALRAAFEALPPVPATAWVRCRDVSAAEPFLATPDERTLLASLAEFRAAETLTPAQSALLRALEHAGLVEILTPEEWEARAGAERVESARRAEEESRREAARVAVEAARAAEERRQAEIRERAEAARRALEAAKAAEAAWRRARDENGEPAPRAVYTTEREFPSGVPPGATPSEFPAGSTASEFPPPTAEFHALSEEMPPLEASASPSPAAPVVGDEPMVPVITRTTLPPFEGPLPSTDPMGASPGVGEEDTLVRAMAGRGQTDPFATGPGRTGRREPPPPARSGTDPYAPPATEREGPPTDPYAQAVPREGAGPATDELPTPPARPFIFPPAAASPTPPGGTGEARTPPGGIMLESEELVLEPEALILPEPGAATTPSAGTLVEELSEALRRAGSDAPPELWQTASTEAVGSRRAERTPLRLGGESTELEADLWKLVSGKPAEQPGSFEAALRQVDGQLEALAGLRQAPADPENPSTVPLATTDLDALVKASFESGEWSVAPAPDTNPDSGRIGLAALSGTPVPGPPPQRVGTPQELPAARRQELLRQARAAAEREPVVSIPTPPPRSLEDAELAEAIEARHAALTRDPDRFAVLGIAPQASRDDVKRAFIELAKVFHPDRLPRSLTLLHSKAARVFDAIREAQEFLLDDVRRSEHARRQSGAGAVRSVDPAVAAEALVSGEMAMRRREYAQAEAFFRQAYEADPRPSTLAAAAWAIYMDPARRSEAAQARAMMVDALKADPDCDRAHYQLGVIARVEGDVERAERHFRETVRSNPRHLEAAQELRLLEMRRRPKKK